MNAAYRALTPSDASWATHIAADIRKTRKLNVERCENESSADLFARTRDRVCKACWYFRSQLAGQAFTQWQCGVCAVADTHSSTAVPRVCGDCAETHKLCTRCGGDVFMRVRRSTWPTPALPPTPPAPYECGDAP